MPDNKSEESAEAFESVLIGGCGNRSIDADKTGKVTVNKYESSKLIFHIWRLLTMLVKEIE